MWVDESLLTNPVTMFAQKSLQGGEGAGNDWRRRRGVSLGRSLRGGALTEIAR